MNTHKEKETNPKTVTPCTLVRVDSREKKRKRQQKEKPVWVGETSTELLPVVQFRNYLGSFTD